MVDTTFIYRWEEGGLELLTPKLLAEVWPEVIISHLLVRDLF